MRCPRVLKHLFSAFNLSLPLPVRTPRAACVIKPDVLAPEFIEPLQCCRRRFVSLSSSCGGALERLLKCALILPMIVVGSEGSDDFSLAYACCRPKRSPVQAHPR